MNSFNQQPNFNQFNDGMVPPPRPQSYRSPTKILLIIFSCGLFLSLAVVGAMALLVMSLIAPRSASEIEDLPSHSFQSDMDAFNTALRNYKEENAIPLMSNGQFDEKQGTKSPTQRSAAEDELRQWCHQQFKALNDGADAPFDHEAFYAAILRSNYGKLSWIEKLSLRSWIEDQNPWIELDSVNQILDVEFANDANGNLNEELAVVHFISTDGGYASSMQWFVIRLEGIWYLYDWQRLEYGRRMSDEYAGYCMSPEETADGYDTVVELLGEADELSSIDPEEALGKVRVAQEVAVSAFDREVANLRISWCLYRLGYTDEAFQLLQLMHRPSHWGCQRTLAIYAEQSDVEEERSQFNTFVQRLKAMAPDHPITHWCLAQAELEQAENDSKSAEELNKGRLTALKHSLARWRLVCGEEKVPNTYDWLGMADGQPAAIHLVFDTLIDEGSPVGTWGPLLQYGCGNSDWSTPLIESLDSTPEIPEEVIAYAKATRHYHAEEFALAKEQFRSVVDSDSSVIAGTELAVEYASYWFLSSALEEGDWDELFSDPKQSSETVDALLDRWWNDDNLYLEEEVAGRLIEALEQLHASDQNNPATQALLAIMTYEQRDHRRAVEYMDRFLSLPAVKAIMEREAAEESEAETEAYSAFDWSGATEDEGDLDEQAEEVIQDAGFIDYLGELREESILAAHQYQRVFDDFPETVYLWTNVTRQVLNEQDGTALDQLTVALEGKQGSPFESLREVVEAAKLEEAGDAKAAALALADAITKSMSEMGTGVTNAQRNLRYALRLQVERLASLIVRAGLYDEDGTWKSDAILKEIAAELVPNATQYRNVNVLRSLLADIKSRATLAAQKQELVEAIFEAAVATSEPGLAKEAFREIDFEALERYQKTRMFRSWASLFFADSSEVTSALIEQLPDESVRNSYFRLLRFVSTGGQVNAQELSEVNQVDTANALQSVLLRGLYHQEPEAMAKLVQQYGISSWRVWEEQLSSSICLLGDKPVELQKEKIEEFVRDAGLVPEKTFQLPDVIGAGLVTDSWIVICKEGHKFAFRQYTAEAIEGYVASGLCQRINGSLAVLEVVAMGMKKDSLQIGWSVAEQALSEEVEFIEINGSLIDLAHDSSLPNDTPIASAYTLGTELMIDSFYVTPENAADAKRMPIVDINPRSLLQASEEGLPVFIKLHHQFYEELLRARVTAEQPNDLSGRVLVRLEDSSQINPAIVSGVNVITSAYEVFDREQVETLLGE